MALVVLVGFGNWQLRRLAWKEDLIAHAEAGLTQPARPLPAGTADYAALDYAHLSLRGTYLHDRAFAFGVEAADGVVGAQLVTPMLLEGDRVILVDRGWLPRNLLPPAVPADLEPKGELALDGVARYHATVSRGPFQPDDEPAARRWYAWDLAAMAAAIGHPVLPLVLTLERSEGPAGLPRTAPVTAEFRNPHLGYAITWYGLAIALLGTYLAFSLRPRNEPNT